MVVEVVRTPVASRPRWPRPGRWSRSGGLRVAAPGQPPGEPLRTTTQTTSPTAMRSADSGSVLTSSAPMGSPGTAATSAGTVADQSRWGRRRSPRTARSRPDPARAPARRRRRDPPPRKGRVPRRGRSRTRSRTARSRPRGARRRPVRRRHSCRRRAAGRLAGEAHRRRARQRVPGLGADTGGARARIASIAAGPIVTRLPSWTATCGWA